ncbi:hypothetical protein SMU61_07965 [Streptococcus mutans G123]|nr:hypothetical protein SMU61_07965 [Streptococcus mutans G123]EMC34654.1 hypothetical protein SMU92_03254 [Streptococcus mutans 14D]
MTKNTHIAQNSLWITEELITDEAITFLSIMEEVCNLLSEV